MMDYWHVNVACEWNENKDMMHVECKVNNLDALFLYEMCLMDFIKIIGMIIDMRFETQ